MRNRSLAVLAHLAAVVIAPAPALAQTRPPVSARTAVSSTLHIHRATGPLAIDGVLDDPGWKDAMPIDEWYETKPGDNIVPRLANRGRLTYDGQALYVGLELEDPDPSAIRAPIADRDRVSSDTDYAGVIIDATGSGRVGTLFLVNASGVQYDSVSDDSTGNEDSSPNFFWDSATRITATGWTLELRIPFSSLSFARRDPQPFRLMLYRNRGREFRYQFFTTQLPHDSPCFICRANPVEGLTGLPEGGGLVAAPYVSGSYAGKPSRDLGSKLHYGSPDLAAGIDAKWRPRPDTIIDVTINPDFSQIESDVALIAANERFALSYPEKRPFFLEGVELLATPIAAVSTRSFTDPQWGARGTVKLDHLAFTALVVQDEGGGRVIIPGATGSELAEQSFRSWAGVGRARYDLGSAYIGALVTTREIDGGGYNRLGGLDVQLRPFDSDLVTGQYLYSATRTPRLPELAAQWDGRWLGGHAGYLKWSHSGNLVDAAAIYRDLGSGFRADDGFVPQVGYREGNAEIGATLRPSDGPIRRVRGFATYDRQVNPGFDLLSQQVTAGASGDAVLGSQLQFNYEYDQVLVAGKLLARHEVVYSVTVNPGAILSRLELSGSAGQQIDFENARTGTGVDVTLGATARPTSHLEVQLNEELRWLDLHIAGQTQTRLFTARVDRLSATYSFTPRLFLRFTGQYEVTRRDPELYLAPVAAKVADFAGSLLFAYKLNWQSVLFVGYGDSRTFLAATDKLEVAARQLFIKLSHAFQW